MQTSNSQVGRSTRKRTEKGRRIWTEREEQVLLAGMNEIITQGWRSENGFRPGYLTILEKYTKQHFPGTDLKGTPHINSRLHTWKRLHGSLFSMLAKSGIGFNHTIKMIEATDEAWEAYVNVDGNAKGMRGKNWPYYEQWCEIFGKDRATGEVAEGFVEAVNQVLNETQTEKEADCFENFDKFFEGLDETGDTVPISQETNSACASAKFGRKMKARDDGASLCEVLGKFVESTEARLGEIAKRIGYEYDTSNARKKVWAIVERFDGMTLNQKLLVSKLLVKNTEELELFFSLPAEAREEFAKMTLSGNL